MKEFYKGKRVLITGHTGFKGSWLSFILTELEADVCGVALEPTNEVNLFMQLELNKKMKSNILDIRNFEALEKIFNEFKPEIVFHLAAQPLVIDSYNDPKYTFDVNVMGTVNVCECVRKTRSVKSFVNVTTDKVYKNLELENYKYKEDDYLDGYDPYSNSKSCSELVTSSYINSFLNDIAVSTCRAGNVIGGGDYSDNRIIPDCVRYAKNNESIIIRNPNSIRPYQHVLEADVFYLMLAKKQYLDSGIASCYNIGPEDTDCITTGGLCDIFCDVWQDGAKWNAIEKNGVHEANFLMLDITKAKEVLEWAPKWNLRKTVESVVEWEKATNKIEITKKQIEDYLGEL